MEGVGARLGRSSTRYGPATVFTGPVRRWKKKWTNVSPSTAPNNNSNNHHHSHTTNNGANGNNGAHLLLYKWTPISQSNVVAANNSNSAADKTPSKEDAVIEAEEPPRRKFKYIPIALLEEQKNEAAENAENEATTDDAVPSTEEDTSKSDGVDEKPDMNDLPMDETQIAMLEEQKNEAAEKIEDEAKPNDSVPSTAGVTSKSFDEKPDMNDVPMEESQGPDNNQIERQDLNESTLDLSLGFTAQDGDHDSDSKTDQNKDDLLERVNTWAKMIFSS